MTEIHSVYTISEPEFLRFRKLIYDHTGIALADGKKATLISRLSRRLRKLKLKSFKEYFNYVTEKANKAELTTMFDLVSTNKTSFFRESHHFDFLRDRIIPELGEDRRLRIWSSACSTGEEPYSIAMTIFDGVDDRYRWNLNVLASDISTEVLDKASKGIYEEQLISEDIPKGMAKQHFLKGKGEYLGKGKAKSHLTDIITFKQINLMDEKFPITDQLNLIFCRNVMIYFDRPTQEILIEKFYRYLKNGGYLFIGHSESLQWIEHKFDYVAPTIYRKVE